MNKIKHFGSYLLFILLFVSRVLRSRAFHIALALIVWTYLIAWFSSNYEMRSSFTFGIYERESSVKKPQEGPKFEQISTPSAMLLSPVIHLSEEEIVMAQPHGRILWNIYQLETQRGKTDGCRKQGKFGGFGVMVDGKVYCYDTFQLAAERAEYWLTQMNPDKDLTNALCTWNNGPAKVDGKVSTYQNCSYYQNYLSL